MTDEVLTIRVPGGTAIEIPVRRSRRARRVGLRVSAGRAELVVPVGVSVRRAGEFAESNAAWLIRKLDESRGHAPAFTASTGLPGIDVLISEGARIPYGGATWILRVETGDMRGIMIEKDDCFLVRAPSGSTAADIGRALRAFLDDELETVFRRCMTRFAEETGRTAAGLRLRDMKTLWGSCSPSGVVTLNRQLSQLPVRIVEYTSFHELCHVAVKGHGKEFWSLLEGLVPDCAGCRDYLRRCR